MGLGARPILRRQDSERQPRRYRHGLQRHQAAAEQQGDGDIKNRGLRSLWAQTTEKLRRGTGLPVIGRPCVTQPEWAVPCRSSSRSMHCHSSLSR